MGTHVIVSARGSITQEQELAETHDVWDEKTLKQLFENTALPKNGKKNSIKSMTRSKAKIR